MGTVTIQIPDRIVEALAHLDPLAADEYQIEVLLRHALAQIGERLAAIVDSSAMEDPELPGELRALARRLGSIAVALDACEGRGPSPDYSVAAALMRGEARNGSQALTQ
jgi:hypothetical protein